MTIQTSLVIAGKSGSRTVASCMRTRDGNSLLLSKDPTLLRLSQRNPATKDSHCHQDTDNHTQSLLGPLISRTYSFDRIYDQSCTPTLQAATSRMRAEELYGRAIRTNIRDAMEGRNVGIILHGSSETTKTEMMIGENEGVDEHGGIISLALEDLLQLTKERSTNIQMFQLSITIMHLVNDTLKDLLYFDGTPLKIVQLEGRDATVHGARRIRLHTLDQIQEIVKIFRTSCNVKEAHTILTVQIEHLDLSIARTLAEEGRQRDMMDAVNLVSTIQFTHLACFDLALAIAPGLRSKPDTQLPSPYPIASSRCQTPSAWIATRNPTLVKSAQARLRKQKTQFEQQSLFETRRIPGLEPQRSNLLVANARTPQVEQKVLAKSFEQLEQVCFQLATKPFAGEGVEINPANHVSYRGNKLTWLLSPTLTNRSNVLLLAFVDPSVERLAGSLHTIRYTARIREWFHQRKMRKEKRKQPAASATSLNDDNMSRELQRYLDAQDGDAEGEGEKENSPPRATAPASLLRDTISPSLLQSRSSLPLRPGSAHVRPPKGSAAFVERMNVSVVPTPVLMHGQGLASVKDQPVHPKQSSARKATPIQQRLEEEKSPDPFRQQQPQSHSRHQTERSPTPTQRLPAHSHAHHASSPNLTATAAVASVPMAPPSVPSALSSHCDAATAAGTSSAWSSFPSRLFDVLSVLRTARFGGREDEPSAAWPYKKDLILTELVDQLAEWQSTIGKGKMESTIDALLREYGPEIPADELKRQIHKLASEQEKEDPRHQQCLRQDQSKRSSLPGSNLQRAPSVSPTSSSSARSTSDLPRPVSKGQPGVVPSASSFISRSSPSAATTQPDPWLHQQMASVKAEMSNLTRQLQGLTDQLPIEHKSNTPADGALYPHPHSHIVPSYDTVEVATGARSPSRSVVSTAIYHDATGRITEFNVRPYDSSRGHVNKLHTPPTILSPPLARLPFDSSGMPTTPTDVPPTAHLIVSPSHSHSHPHLVNPSSWLAAEFNFALQDQTELFSTIHEAESIMKRMREKRKDENNERKEQ